MYIKQLKFEDREYSGDSFICRCSTPVGKFIYGRDKAGVYYWQSPFQEVDVGDERAAIKGANADFSTLINAHPVLEYIV